MPELPEIETIRCCLVQRITDLYITHIKLNRKDLRYAIPKNLTQNFVNQRVKEVTRRAKYLLIHFYNDKTLIIHLGMSGRLYFTNANSPRHKHDHVIFDFNDNTHMRMRDHRRFGFLSFTETKNIKQHKFFSHLGIEPLSHDFDGHYLFCFCKKSSAPIKSVLMNAKVVVGLGNIYANESLFLAGIRPQHRARRLSRPQLHCLSESIKSVLKDSIAHGGTSFRDYVNADEEPGLHQLDLYIYGREGEKCRRCQNVVKKLTICGRGSFFCPRCQR